MSAFEVRDIEFRSDGVKDSLTESMAPALFREALIREIASAKREDRELVLLTIALQPSHFDSVAKFQEALIEIAFALRQGLRGGDFFARISDHGFWLLLRTNESGAKLVLNRLDLPRQEALITQLVARKYDEHAEWINRVDQLFFN